MKTNREALKKFCEWYAGKPSRKDHIRFCQMVKDRAYEISLPHMTTYVRRYNATANMNDRINEEDTAELRANFLASLGIKE